ncbi:MAG: hypothetical protein Q8O84_03600 [Nanoarchaeota archaeon]|nr:hypothetical protein [Nanoarchaeota archaeon]
MQTIIWIILVIFSLILLGIISYFIIAKSKGRIEIILDKYQYSPGETINGKVKLIIKKPLVSKELKISLIGQQKIKSRKMNINRQNSRNEFKTIEVFNFAMPLHKQKEYTIGGQEINFQIKIPNNILNSQEPKVLGFLGAFDFSARKYPIKWYLSADLEVPGINPYSKKIQVNIG